MIGRNEIKRGRIIELVDVMRCGVIVDSNTIGRIKGNDPSSM